MEKQKKLLSVIVPCYNEEEVLPYFYDEITRVAGIMNETDFEFIFVNDGSGDKTLSVIRRYAEKDKRVRFVSFSRNFGKEAAMYAGLETAKGDYIAIMDSDLQDPPALLPEMLETIKKENCDGIATKRKTRKGEPIIRSLFANIFYKIINKISKVQMIPGARDYFLIKRQMRDSILDVCEYNRYTKGIFNWVGFDVRWIAYDNVERAAGKTKWSFWKLFKYSLECVISFSTAPLAISSFVGFFLFLISIIGIIAVIIRDFAGIQSAAGWPSMICVILFISGVQLFCIGILGQYLSRTYLETKKRPLYIIKETEETFENNKKSEEES